MSRQQGPLDLTTLAGTIAVVTGGANNGIGWGLAKHAAGLGMHVVVLDLHEKPVRDAERRLREEFPAVAAMGLCCDVTRPDSLANALAQIQKEMPEAPIGAVFANAGVSFNRRILKSTLEEWTATLNVNVLGVVNTLQTFVPVMTEQQGPSVVCTTASIGGLVRGDVGTASYQASKHAVVALTESLSFELAERHPHVRVHVLCPCIVESALATTSQTNARVAGGELAAEAVEAGTVGGIELAMTTEDHAQQVFDLISAGKFYVVTDNVRPYVDHDFPFDGLGIVRERFENMLDLELDNADAFEPGPNGLPTAILKGPIFGEMRRRREGS